RNGPLIEQKLSTYKSRALLSLELKDNEASISDAVNTYIKYSVSRLGLVQDDEALQDDLEKAMRQKVNGTFLWVSLVMKELEQVESWDALQVIDEIPSDLKEVYARMLEQILQLKRGNHRYCIQLLSTACATYRPLSLSELGCQSYKWSWATLSPDGKLAATISETDDLIIWDLTGAFSHLPDVPIRGFLIAAVFSADSRQFALVYSNEVHIWDVATNTRFRTLAGRFIAADNTAVFSPNGQQFASYVYEKEIRIWSIETGGCIKILPRSEAAVAVVFSPDGLRIASALGDKTIKIWDTITGNRLQTIHGLNHTLLSVAFSKNGRELASASSEGVARIWNLDTGHTALIPDIHIRGIDQVIFSKDNKLIESISYGELHIWNTVDGTCSQTLPTEGTIFSEDGQRLAFIGEDHTIYITNSDLTRYIEIPKGYVEQLRDITFTSNGRYFVTMGDEMVKIWEPTTGECLQTIQDTWPVVLMACSPDSQRVAIGVATMPWTHSAQLVKIWDLTTKKRFQTLNTPNCSLIFFSPDGKLLGTVTKSYRHPGMMQQVKSWDVSE
ncbi:hypothetical protein N5P37_011037, partial [Trichoderma harzianum]